MNSIAPELKALRNRTVPKISSRDVAAALEMAASTYAAYEDPKKFKKPILPLDLAKRLVPIFAERGVPEAETLRLAGITGDLNVPAPASSDDEWVEVGGAVQAGVWRAESDWPAAERYDVRFGPPPFPGAKRFGVRMEGLSMNRTIPPGADLECLWVKFSTTEPKPGDLVIAERHRHDLTEMTCKRLAIDGDELVLHSESFEPEFQEVIRVGRAGDDVVTDDEVRILGIVLSAKLDLAPRGLSERRYRVR